MKRQDTVTMDGEEFDSIHTKLWLNADHIDRGNESIADIRWFAQDALDIMDREED